MPFLKKILLIFCLSFSFLLVNLAHAQSQDLSIERILNFASEITINQDSSLLVKETIVVNCLGDQIKRGIYRDFPTTYQNGFFQTKVPFDLISVKRDGQPDSYHFESLSNGIRLYIGRSDYFLPHGVYTYEIIYQTARQLGYFNDHDELYWNVTGNGWVFPIDQATAKVILAGPAKEDFKIAAYTGPMGSKEQNFKANIGDDGIFFFTTKPLNSYEGLTIVVGWPKGYVHELTASEKQANFWRDNGGIFVAWGLALAVLIYYVLIWFLVGRDPKKGAIIAEYEPPINLSAAEVGYLKKMGYSQKLLSAQIIQMAIKGLLVITGGKKFFGKSYELTRVQAPAKQPSLAEKEILDNLFGAGLTLKLENDNYQKIQDAVKALIKQLKGVNQNSQYFKTNFVYWLIGLILGLFAVVFLIATMMPTLAAYLSFAIIVLLVFFNILFFKLIKVPTVLGRKLMDQIEGFKLFLAVTEKDRMNFHNPPEKTPELFEKCLPYALALGVEQKWAEQFNEVFARLREQGRDYSPGWYSGHFDSLAIGSFAGSLGSSFSHSVSSAATPPGSSSGFGGGGGSGGGGGGGGGGGW